MRARFAIAGSLVMMLVLAMLMSPAAGQTAISPEVTPEATAEPGPPFPVVLSRPNYCVLSPDDTAVAVMNDGVYNVADGSLRFELPVVPEDPNPSNIITVNFADDGHFVRVGRQMFDGVTGEPVDRTLEYIVVTSNERWRVINREIYDAHTGEQVGTLPPLDGLPTPIDIEFVWNSDVILITAGSQEEQTILVGAPTGDILAEIENTPFSFSYDGTRYAIAGDGIYDIASRQRIAVLPEGDYWPSFSPFDPAWIAIQETDGVAIYDAFNGGEIVKLAPPEGANVWETQWGDDTIFVSGGVVTHHADGGMSGSSVPGRLYAVPSGELLRDDAHSMGYIGGARRAWQSSFGPWGVFDPFTGEVLVPDGYASRLNDDRVAIDGRGEYDIDTWELLFAYPPNIGSVFEIDEGYRYIVSSGGLYDAHTGDLLFNARGHNIDLSRDGRILLATRFGESCTVYRLPEAQE
jgi:hypothetical protein